MSTNSSIKMVKHGETEAKSIYCHRDGYIAYNGVILQRYYNTPKKVAELIALGNLSALGFYTEPKGEHSFDKPEEDCCVAYHRDRGEEFSQNGGHQEFDYIYDVDERCWYVDTDNWISKTYGTKELDIQGYCRTERKLLLDAIIENEKYINKIWKDENPNIIEECKQKAKEARKEIIKKNAEEYDAYYNAYCL